MLAADVVLCTLESLSKHRSQDPWGLLDAKDGRNGGGEGGNTGAGTAQGSRRRGAREGGWLTKEPEALDRPSNMRGGVSARRRSTRRADSGIHGNERDSEDDEDEQCGFEDGSSAHVRVACHALLHKVSWARLVVDDAHVLFAAASSRLAPQASEEGGAPHPASRGGFNGSRDVGRSGVSSTGGRRTNIRGRNGGGGGGGARGGASVLSASDTKAEALSWIRAKSRWCVLSATKAPKLWRSREQLRNLVTAVGAPPGVSLVRLVPELVLELE